MAKKNQLTAKALAESFGSKVTQKAVKAAQAQGYTTKQIQKAASQVGNVGAGAQKAIDRAPATSNQRPNGINSSRTSYPTTPFGSTAFNAVNQWARQNEGNDVVAGMANDLAYNTLSAGIQTEMDVNYVRQMAPEALNYQRQSQNILTAADTTRMAAEGAVTQDLLRTQGDYQLKNTTIEADANKYGYDRQLQGKQVDADAAKYGYDKQAQASMYGADRGLDVAKEEAGAQRYGYDKQAQASMYGADKTLEGTRVQADAQRYGYDRQLEATRYSKDSDERVAFGGYASAEKQIGLQGDEARKTLRQGTDETLRLRADARGAIKRSGARFYG